MMQRLGIAVDVAQSECIALHNFLMFQSAAAAAGGRKRPARPDGDRAAAGRRLPAPLARHAGRRRRRRQQPADRLAHRPLGPPHWALGGYSVTRALVQQFN